MFGCLYCTVWPVEGVGSYREMLHEGLAQLTSLHLTLREWWIQFIQLYTICPLPWSIYSCLPVLTKCVTSSWENSYHYFTSFLPIPLEQIPGWNQFQEVSMTIILVEGVNISIAQTFSPWKFFSNEKNGTHFYFLVSILWCMLVWYSA